MITNYESRILGRLYTKGYKTITLTALSYKISNYSIEWELPKELFCNSFSDYENFPDGTGTTVEIAKLLQVDEYSPLPKCGDVVITRAGLKYKITGDNLCAMYSDEVIPLINYEDNQSKICPSEDILIIIRNGRIAYDNWEA